jgi:microcystin-dependent protein
MLQQFMGQLMLFPFAFAPQGWALCAGQLLPINQNQPLFALLGTTFGGDGRINFALPDLRGRTPVMAGSGISLGQPLGQETHTLTLAEVPSHSHPPTATTATAGQTPVKLNGLLLATSMPAEYVAGTATSAMASGVIGQTGGSVAHENRTPYLVMNWCISLTGMFPTRS